MSSGCDIIPVMDRGYVHYLLLGHWCEAAVRCVTRMKDATRYRVVDRREAAERVGTLRDEVIELTAGQAAMQCLNRLSRIHYRDVGTG